MGNFATHSTPIIGRCIRKPTRRILFFGLDGAGKTTMLYQLKLGQVVTTIPTIGFNIETIEASYQGHKIDIQAWDVSSRGKMRPLLRHYYDHTDGIIFVVDRTDVERISEVEEMFQMATDPKLQSSPIIIVINKQDIEKPNIVTEERLRSIPIVKEMINQKRSIEFRNVSAKTGDGLQEAMSWLAEVMFVGPNTKLSVDKPEVGAHWMIDLGKRVLCFGT